LAKKPARGGDDLRARDFGFSGLHPIPFHLGVAEISVFEVLRFGKAAQVRARVRPLTRSYGALGAKARTEPAG
jgi:hypothetical protein